jgi:5,10-methylenetetrahydrofolate reductase
MVPVERTVKEQVFGCHMCGQCILHSTGMTCPMNCPKNLRNGPCGGVGQDGSCEVDSSKKCVWFKAVNRSQSTPWPDEIYQRNPPVDWSLKGHSSWVNTFTGRDHHDRTEADWRLAAILDKSARPMYSGSNFERRLRAGQFVVGCEVNPRPTADATSLIEYVRTLAGKVDVLHISDNAFSMPRMCNLASAALVEAAGLETCLHISCKDRNRLMLEADILGACAVGIKNIFCLGGDHTSLGDHPQAKPVFDIDSVNFINLVRNMRDFGRASNGEIIDPAPHVFIGGAAAPTAPPLEFRPHRLGKKAAAGADFIITQVIFDMALFSQYMQRVRDLGLHEKVHILAVVSALPGPKTAERLNGHVGIVIPDHMMKRLSGVPKERQRAEGVKICVETIQQLREMPGVAGIDVMDLLTDSWFPTVEIVEAAGLLPRPPLTQEVPLAVPA